MVDSFVGIVENFFFPGIEGSFEEDGESVTFYQFCEVVMASEGKYFVCGLFVGLAGVF